MAENEDTTTESAEANPEAAAEDTAPAPADTGPDGSAGTEPAAAESQEALAPRERRSRARAARAATERQRPPRTPEQRQADRVAERRRKARLRSVGRAKAAAKAKARAHDHVDTPPRQPAAGRPKVRQGVVVSDKADKTITVRIDVARRHPRYEKIVRTSRTLHAHDEGNDAHVGDSVTVLEARPLSATKRWRLVRVLERAR